ncbi:hypothetical protein JCM10908_001260 [Rhodotorula pacifica]|uniref:uncharacterized protein n=1 Tax=Rhodotorula pacifica TaxID=1495444 RepID=UPI0031718EB2
MLRPVTRSVATTARRSTRPSVPAWLLQQQQQQQHHLALPHTRRHYARPPSFTTPDESPQTHTSTSQEQEQRVSAQAERVLDSYASPFANTASSAYTLFRYAVFGSVFLVASSLAAFTAAHLYVEHVALAGPGPNVTGSTNDPDEWTAEAEGWTGLHTEKHGGTDPRLGLWTRMAIRAAWMSQNWGSGTVAAPESGPAASASASTNASPFAVSAPRRIGEAGPGGAGAGAGAGASVDPAAARQVHDAGWIMAERYLAQALKRASETRGISLVDSRDWEAHIEHGGVDRAAVELEERLAGIRERIGGRTRLQKAREGWERIYYALEASPSDPLSRRDQAAWEQREKLRATRKIGELSARIADSWRAGSDERESELEKAEGWFLGGLIPALAGAEGQSLAGRALDRLVPEAHASTADEQARKHVSPSSSFFGFWSRSHPPATRSTSSAPFSASSPTLPSAELDHLIALLSSSAATSSFSSSSGAAAQLSPASQRAIIATLVSLETHLARRASTSAADSSSSSILERAQALQSAALEYAQSLAANRPLLPASAPSPSSDSLTAADLSRRLSALWISTRLAALETHLSECRLALALSSSSSAGRKKSLPVDLADAESLLLATSRAEQTSDASAAVLAALETAKNGKAKEIRKVYEEPLKRVRRDADKVVEMGTALSELVASLLPQNKEQGGGGRGWFK